MALVLRSRTTWPQRCAPTSRTRTSPTSGPLAASCTSCAPSSTPSKERASWALSTRSAAARRSPAGGCAMRNNVSKARNILCGRVSVFADVCAHRRETSNVWGRYWCWLRLQSRLSANSSLLHASMTDASHVFQQTSIYFCAYTTVERGVVAVSALRTSNVCPSVARACGQTKLQCMSCCHVLRPTLVRCTLGVDESASSPRSAPCVPPYSEDQACPLISVLVVRCYDVLF